MLLPSLTAATLTFLLAADDAAQHPTRQTLRGASAVLLEQNENDVRSGYMLIQQETYEQTIYVYINIDRYIYNGYTQIHIYPIGSMYAIYGNMDPINIPPMLAYIPAPWIRHGY